MMQGETVLTYRIDGLGHVPAFKNSKKIVRFGKRAALKTKAEYRDWMDAATVQVRSQVKQNPATARAWQKRGTPKGKNRLAAEWSLGVSVRVTLLISALNSADPTGAVETVMDVLRDAGAIADDSPRYIRAVAVHWRPVDKGDEGAVIAVTID